MRTPTLPDVRVVRGALSVSVSHQFVDANGDAADPTSGGGVVTVAIATSDGTAVSGVGSVSGSGTDPRSASLPNSAVASVDWLTVSWSIDATVVAVDTVEVVGGVLINQTSASAIDATLGATVVTAARFHQARAAVEDLITAELGRSPFPRFYTERLAGTGTCELPVSWPDVTEVVWARIWSGSTSTALTSTELAAIPADPSGLLRRTDGNVWPSGCDVEVGYRFGMSNLPNDLRENLVMAIRYHIKHFNADLPYLGETVNLDGVGTLRSNRPGVGMSITGNDEIDARIRAHRFHIPGIA